MAKNFDGLITKFHNNIYNTGKGKLRLAVLQRDLAPWLAADATPISVLDIGCGMAPISLPLGQVGHDITLCDLSSEMLTVAASRFSEAQLPAPQQHCGHFDSLPAQQYPLVLAHAMLEWNADHLAVLNQLAQHVAPGGSLSLLFYNRHGQVMHNLVAGNFGYLKSGLKLRKTVRLTPDHPVDLEVVLDWAQQHQWQLTTYSGVRVFHDYLRDRAQANHDWQDVLRFELEYSSREPYWRIARYIHLLLKKADA